MRGCGEPAHVGTDLADDLLGDPAVHTGHVVSEVLSLLDYLDESIDRLSAEIDRVIARFADERDLLTSNMAWWVLNRPVSAACSCGSLARSLPRAKSARTAGSRVPATSA